VTTIYGATWTTIRGASTYANVPLYTGRKLDAETGLYSGSSGWSVRRGVVQARKSGHVGLAWPSGTRSQQLPSSWGLCGYVPDGSLRPSLSESDIAGYRHQQPPVQLSGGRAPSYLVSRSIRSGACAFWA